MTNSDDEVRAWLHSVRGLDEAPAAPLKDRPAEVNALLDMAWAELSRQHASFEPYALRAEDLASGFRALDEIFLSGHNDLTAYFAEAYLRSPSPPTPFGDSRQLAQVVLIQTRLMEQTFELLQLDRYGNAPKNRGWMNLFRRWGMSDHFNQWFDTYRDLFTRHFVRFYDDYLRKRPEGIDLDRVPHPWDHDARREPGEYDREEQAWAWLLTAQGVPFRGESRRPLGVFHDSGLYEANAEGSASSADEEGEEPPKPGAPPHPAGPDSGGAPGGPQQGVPNK